MIEYKDCKLQGIGRTLKLNLRILNYFSHIKTKKRTCDIVDHFFDKHGETWKEEYEENELFRSKIKDNEGV